MALAQNILSGGATTYDNLVGASVITLVMFLVHTFVYSILRLDRWFYWLTYLPSFLVLAVLTDVTPDGSGSVYNHHWLWLAPLIIVLYVIMVRLFSEVDGLGKDGSSAGIIFSKLMWVNLLAVTVMMLLVVRTGNTDVTFHHRIKTENYIIAGDYDKALDVGNNYSESDESLTMLRAYALAVEGKLPERLFEFPVAGGSSALRPDGKNVVSLMVHEGDIIKFINTRDMRRHGVSVDYRLCGSLADCRLGEFKKELQRHYVIDSMLPKHYKEALLMAGAYEKGDTVHYADSIMTSDYCDFLEISRKYTDKNELREALKERYSKTYWYYYVCNRKK